MNDMNDMNNNINHMNLRQKFVTYLMRGLEKVIERAERYKEIDSQFSTDFYRAGRLIFRLPKTNGEWLEDEKWKKEHIRYAM